ncbi:MAG TPA: hypothetical protein VIV12_07905, partial [Streptosporangiaceae bacterium]
MPDPLPPRDYVLRGLSTAQHASEDWHAQISHWRDLYKFIHYKTRPKPGETQYSDPSYTNTVDLAVGVLLGNNLDWKAYGWRSSPSEEEGTSRIEQYLAGVIDINSLRNEYSIAYEAILHFVRDGCGVIYSVWDGKMGQRFLKQMDMPSRDNPAEVEKRRVYTEVPIRMQVIDPLSIHLVPGEPGRWSRV